MIGYVETMFRRQKILLALLEQFGGELSRTSLQKLLFLYSQEHMDPVYDFVPYKFGCFSFQAAADQKKLTEAGLLCDTDRWKLTKKSAGFSGNLTYAEREALWKLKKQYGELTQNELIRHVYTKYPYYAIRSEIAGEYLTTEEQQVVQRHIPNVTGKTICSVGYEGCSLEGYINQLLHRDVGIVCDVRKNPLSRKFGFSKRSLNNALEHMGIAYRHFPELGIVSDKRKALNTQADYDALFDDYEKTTLKAGGDAIAELVCLLEKYERIALLCYEKLPEQCHRTRVANAVVAASNTGVSVYTG
ncbi:MAG: DUF488 domain-containing protein [Verrucomicrobiae bacterium]|nr:DUF488 domain-containing protein [Verrucomicrobiae bacterium]